MSMYKEVQCGRQSTSLELPDIVHMKLVGDVTLEECRELNEAHLAFAQGSEPTSSTGSTSRTWRTSRPSSAGGLGHGQAPARCGAPWSTTPRCGPGCWPSSC